MASVECARERFQLQRYLGSMEKLDEESQASIDPSAVQAGLAKLKQNPEPEAGFMLMRGVTLPAYNFQSAVDAEHALIVAHEVVLDAADNRCLQPMAEAAQAALGVESLHVVADAGYSNGQQVANCEAAGIMAHAPTARTVNTRSGGLLFTSSSSRYQAETDTCLCPADKTLRRKAVREKDKYTVYAATASDRGSCDRKSQRTNSARRTVTRHLYDEALESLFTI